MGARFYSADVGRFLSTDPLGLMGGDANLYRYAANDPVNSIDPSGLINWPPKVVYEQRMGDDGDLGAFDPATNTITTYQGANKGPGCTSTGLGSTRIGTRGSHSFTSTPASG
jgi:uncharacterized protein RhaS with RHS repeats